MRRLIGAFIIFVGLVAMLAGVGWHRFSIEETAINKMLASNDYSGALEAIAKLRAEPLFQAAGLLPGLNENLSVKEGWALYKVGDKERSAKVFRELAESSNAKRGAGAIFNAATLDLSPETFDRAIRDYEEVLKKNPNHLSAQKNLEILRQIEQEERKGSGDDGSDQGSSSGSTEGDAEKDKKKRSRTKDKLEYRDGGSGSSDSSPNLRY